MKLPLKNLIKKRVHAELAALQDEAVDLLYSLFPEAVFHGGTAIWRCYGGNRFSEDLDFYAHIKEGFEDGLKEAVLRRGLVVSKYRRTQNNVFAKISNGKIEVSLEIAVRKKGNPVLCSYEKVDGSLMSVLSLSKEDLVIEKANAFLNRKLIRDVYDVYFLSATADLDRVKNELLSFVKNAPSPVDEKNLKVLLFSGAVPSFRQMIDVIARRAK